MTIVVLNKEQWQEVLKPLGIKIQEKTEFRETWISLATVDTNTCVAMMAQDGGMHLLWHSLEKLAKTILEDCQEFYLDTGCTWKQLGKNPFLGCKNFEEMKIRADLVGRIA